MVNTGRRNLIAAWAVLVGLTIVSWSVGDHHGSGVKVATTIVLVIAFVKALLVGGSFMEIGHSAPLLQRLFAGWCALICLVVVVLYLTVH